MKTTIMLKADTAQRKASRKAARPVLTAEQAQARYMKACDALRDAMIDLSGGHVTSDLDDALAHMFEQIDAVASDIVCM